MKEGPLESVFRSRLHENFNFRFPTGAREHLTPRAYSGEHDNVCGPPEVSGSYFCGSHGAKRGVGVPFAETSRFISHVRAGDVRHDHAIQGLAIGAQPDRVAQSTCLCDLPRIIHRTRVFVA